MKGLECLIIGQTNGVLFCGTENNVISWCILVPNRAKKETLIRMHDRSPSVLNVFHLVEKVQKTKFVRKNSYQVYN